MLTRLKPRLTYANVVSSIALFAVLGGGGAYAVSKIGPKEIRKNAVRSKHIKDGQVRTRDTNLVRYARAPGTLQTAAPGTLLVRTVSVRAKRGDLLAVHGRIRIRRISGSAGPCHVGLEMNGPIGLTTTVMAAFNDRVYIGDGPGGALIGDAKPLTLPVVEPGRYRFRLFTQVPEGNVCEYADRNIWVEVIR